MTRPAPRVSVQIYSIRGGGLVVMPWLPMGERPATAVGWQALGRRMLGLEAQP